MKLSKRMNLFALFCILMLTVHVFARKPAQNLQDSLTADSLSKISLALDVDTSNAVDTNKVEHVDAGIEVSSDSANVNPAYYPFGFTIEAAYAGPAILQLRLLGGRGNPEKIFENKWFSFGYAAAYLDVDFQRGYVSDECLFFFLLYVICGSAFGGDHPSETFLTFFEVLQWTLNGNTYLSLPENGRVGLFETHHFVDYLISGMSSSRGWEFGWSQALGVRFVLSKNDRGSGYYIDLGGHVEITNQRKLFGAFVQLGLFGTRK